MNQNQRLGDNKNENCGKIQIWLTEWPVKTERLKRSRVGPFYARVKCGQLRLIHITAFLRTRKMWPVLLRFAQHFMQVKISLKKEKLVQRIKVFTKLLTWRCIWFFTKEYQFWCCTKNNSVRSEAKGLFILDAVYCGICNGHWTGSVIIFCPLHYYSVSDDWDALGKYLIFTHTSPI